jgi:hypothetical protein
MAATPLASTASSSRTLVSAMFYSDQHWFPLPCSRPPLPGVRGHAAPAHHPLLRRPRASPTSSVRPQPPSMPPEHGIESASSSSSSTLSSRRRSIKACSFASPTPSSTSAPSSSSTPVAAPLLSPRQRQPQGELPPSPYPCMPQHPWIETETRRENEIVSKRKQKFQFCCFTVPSSDVSRRRIASPQLEPLVPLDAQHLRLHLSF